MEVIHPHIKRLEDVILKFTEIKKVMKISITLNLIAKKFSVIDEHADKHLGVNFGHIKQKYSFSTETIEVNKHNYREILAKVYLDIQGKISGMHYIVLQSPEVLEYGFLTRGKR